MTRNAKQLYRFGDYSFDTEQKILLRAGREIALTPKTICLLRILVEKHGRIIEKEELMTALWQDSFVEEGNLKFTVNQLRKAIGDNAQHPRYIETISRRGYRFIAPVKCFEISDEMFTNGVSANVLPKKLPPNNLSVELSPLIGRESELAEIAALLTRKDVRLLTITGIGGTGKTRLAQTIARKSLELFEDGVYFIDLSAIERTELVVPIIAQTLGIREKDGKTLKEYPREYLGERQILFVLDNFEQIAEAAPQIGELLSASDNVKFLITSRVRLQLSFEYEFILQPLKVPFNGDLSLSRLSEYSAIKMFVARAKALKTSFDLTEDNAQTVAEICRRLDGLPLAIELAAGRIKFLTPQAILARLSDSLSLLKGGARNLPARQQTMRATIQWSYDLLTEEEKQLLNRLAVFTSGFTLEAAEMVSNEKRDLNIDTLDAVSSLGDKSLLSQSEIADGEPRFWMLTVVREFALEALEQSGELHEIKRQHADFYAQLCISAEPYLFSAKAEQWLTLLEREHDNLRAAIEWSLRDEPETALLIVGRIYSFWLVHGYLSEGRKWMTQALDRTGEKTNPKLLVKAYQGLGYLSMRQGDLEEAALYFEKSLTLARKIDHKHLLAVSLEGLACTKYQQGELVRAKALTKECLPITGELNLQTIMSLNLNCLGQIARVQKDYEAARPFYEEALAIAKTELSKFLTSIYTSNLASAACLLGDYDSAYQYAAENLIDTEASNYKIEIGITLNIFAALLAAGGGMEKAARLWGAAQAIFDATGYKLEKADQEFYDHYLCQVQTELSKETFGTAFKEGQSMPLKQAIAFARADR